MRCSIRLPSQDRQLLKSSLLLWRSPAVQLQPSDGWQAHAKWTQRAAHPEREYRMAAADVKSHGGDQCGWHLRMIGLGLALLWLAVTDVSEPGSSNRQPVDSQGRVSG